MAKKKSSKKSKSSKKRPAKVKAGSFNIEDFQPTYSPDVATVWIDRTEILVRENPEVVYLRFETAIFGPNVRQEVCRLCMSKKHAQSLVDVLSKNLNYRPKE